MGKLNGMPCPQVFGAGGGTQAPRSEAQPDAPGTPVSPENTPAPASRATLGAALTAVRAAQTPPPPGAAVPGQGAASEAPPLEPQAWQRFASRKLLSLLFLLNDKVMELRKREPTEDAPEEGDDEFDAAADSLSQSVAIWFPATALPPWGAAAMITAGMLGDRWIMSTPLEDEDEKPPAARTAATAAPTTRATPPPATRSADHAAEMPLEIG